ncbi:hypothetical protein KY321_04580 [Candidatus Woesearchaeota archaeon]|nr:hypothetical protein [Candidatus Woesearchaeota archaeon]
MLEKFVEKKNEIANYIRASEVANVFTFIYTGLAAKSLDHLLYNFNNNRIDLSHNFVPFLCFSITTLTIGLLQSYTLDQFKKYNATKEMIDEGTFDIEDINEEKITYYQYLALVDSGYSDLVE